MTEDQRATLTRIERKFDDMEREVRGLIADLREAVKAAQQAVDGGEAV